jgi:hypothetical protein
MADKALASPPAIEQDLTELKCRGIPRIRARTEATCEGKEKDRARTTYDGGTFRVR